MIKLLIWLAGDCALLYAIDRMGLWHQIVAAVVLVCAALWILGGAIYFGRGPGRPLPKNGARSAETNALRERARAMAAEYQEREAAK